MTQSHVICYGNCAVKYVGGVLVLRKLNFRGLKAQLDVKKVNFRGLIAKFGRIGLFWRLESIHGSFSLIMS